MAWDGMGGGRAGACSGASNGIGARVAALAVLCPGGGFRKAREALERLRGADAAVDEELAGYEAEAAPSPFEGEGVSRGEGQVASEVAGTGVRRPGLAEVLKDRALLIPVGIGVSMQVFQQFSGINSFIMFTGSVVGSPVLGALVMVAQVLATTVSFGVVDRAGRCAAAQAHMSQPRRQGPPRNAGRRETQGRSRAISV